ncbi:hypothetical protein MNV49_003132 [Pseudohyphozyma bogoriensis]|nr:hypothetical protein MNV49_003132 [Pseudohyphozyma bogoriensis]
MNRFEYERRQFNGTVSTTTPGQTTDGHECSNSYDWADCTASSVICVVPRRPVVVVGTSTFTSALPATTVTSLNTASSGANNASSGGLSSGAKAGVIAGSTVGGVAILAFLLVACIFFRRKRKNQKLAKENIIWPALVQNDGDRAALYPEQTHATGKAGVGEDMEEVGAGMGGAGLAGRWNSQSSNGRNPTLPSIPPSVYSDSPYTSGAPASHYGHSPYSPPQSSYAGYSGGSQQSHSTGAPLNPNVAGIGAGVGAAGGGIDYHRSTPSPPMHHGQGGSGGSSSGHGHDLGSGNSPLPLPGSEMDHEEIGRPVSPTPMQVGGGPFGPGYDESGGKWRLSVVNNDP